MKYVLLGVEVEWKMRLMVKFCMFIAVEGNADIGLIEVLGKNRMVHRRTSRPPIQCTDRIDRKSTRLNSSHSGESRMPSSA